MYVPKMKKLFQCVWCDRSFRGVNTWLSHLARDHTDKTETSCPNCSKCFTKNYSMRVHLSRRECLDHLPKNQCSYCDKLFTTHKNCSKHELNICLQSMVTDDGRTLFSDAQKKFLDSIELDL